MSQGQKHPVFNLLVFVIRTFNIRICFEFRISIFEFWLKGVPVQPRVINHEPRQPGISPQIPHTPLLTGAAQPVGRIFIRNPITLFTSKDPKVQRGKRPSAAEMIFNRNSEVFTAAKQKAGKFSSSRLFCRTTS